MDKKGFVPEAEIFYIDPEKKNYEKTSLKIKKTLKNPKLSQLEKQVKYQSLNRKRKILSKQLETKPLRVIINSNVQKEMPTTGIEHIENKKIKQENVQQDREQFNARRNIEEVREQRDRDQRREQQQVQEPENQEQQRDDRKLTFTDFKGIISEQKFDQLADYVYNNRVKFGILETGQIYKNKTDSLYPVPGSRYRDVLGYLTGQKDISNEQKNVAGILIRRLFKDDQIKNFVKQEGHGIKLKPRYIIDTQSRSKNYNKNIKNINKTQGLIRKFRPTLWTKVPI
jgi:hypothetical protein